MRIILVCYRMFAFNWSRPWFRLHMHILQILSQSFLTTFPSKSKFTLTKLLHQVFIDRRDWMRLWMNWNCVRVKLCSWFYMTLIFWANWWAVWNWLGIIWLSHNRYIFALFSLLFSTDCLEMTSLINLDVLANRLLNGLTHPFLLKGFN